MKSLKHTTLLTLPLAFGLIYFGPGSHSKIEQPVLTVRSVKIIQEDGLKFKDLNKNGTLDRYEDWRLPAEGRSQDLLSKMSLEEKVGFMLISTTRLKNDWSFEKPKNSDPMTSDFNEDDLVTEVNMFTREPLAYPMMNAAGTTKAVTKLYLRHFILRADVKPRILSEWSNKLQALCESTPLGIPAIVASNPRNHVTANRAIGTTLGQTAFSVWPGELGLAAMRDLKLTREFAEIARKEWVSVGLRKGYMYMADLSTEPRWQRIDGTFGENAEWAADMIKEVVLGFQGDSLNGTSVALTIKHFPGGGAGQGGQDAHFPWGKNEVFPGKMFENNLIPFKTAIAAGTSGIMPYYSVPVGTEYQEIAYAYNKGIIQDLLRSKLGFKGIINSDTGPIDMMPWGAESLSITERYKATLEAGINLYSGSADPTKLLETVKSGMADIKYIDQSVLLLLQEKFKMGLFENPYVDENAAEKLAGSKAFQDKANIALRKSIVLLRNRENLLPLKTKTKVYFTTVPKAESEGGNGLLFDDKNGQYRVEFVNTPELADVILLWVKPRGTTLFASKGDPLLLSLSKNGVDVKYINELTAKKPAILAMNYSNPWVIDEVFNEKIKGVKAVLATFGTTADALLDIVTGKFNPQGRMPFTTPVSEAAVTHQKEDVPGYLEGPEYALFRYDEGIGY